MGGRLTGKTSDSGSENLGSTPSLPAIPTTMGIRQTLAEWLNECGRRSDDAGRSNLATRLYGLASAMDPNWSVPWYNRGLIAKYARQWDESLRLNQRALELDPDNEAACWNLGIAATALHDWHEALRAWRLYGVKDV